MIRKPRFLASLTVTLLLLAACGNEAPAQNEGSGGAPPTPVPAPRVEPVRIDPHSGEEIEIPLRNGGTAQARAWATTNPRLTRGLLFVSGVDGGFIEPADGIYTRLARRMLEEHGLASIFVRYRRPGNLAPSVQDALAGVDWLKSRGVREIGLIGWSFGGAVITNTPPKAREIRTVIGFAPQARFTEPIAEFTDQSLLLIHSRDDENVPFRASQQILAEAPHGIRAELLALDGPNHRLDGYGDFLETPVYSWIVRELALGNPFTDSATLLR